MRQLRLGCHRQIRIQILRNLLQVQALWNCSGDGQCQHWSFGGTTWHSIVNIIVHVLQRWTWWTCTALSVAVHAFPKTSWKRRACNVSHHGLLVQSSLSSVNPFEFLGQDLSWEAALFAISMLSIANPPPHVLSISAKGSRPPKNCGSRFTAGHFSLDFWVFGRVWNVNLCLSCFPLFSVSKTEDKSEPAGFR